MEGAPPTAAAPSPAAVASLAAAAPLVLLGAGRMGGAMLQGWLDRGLRPGDVTVVDPGLDVMRRADLETVGVRVLGNAGDAVAGIAPRVLLLAVKPQIMADVLARCAALAGPDTIVVSIAAGVRLATLEAAFRPRQAVVRAMPNTPAQIGQGMTVAVGNSRFDEGGRRAVHALLSAVGDVAWIEDDALMDAVTAVSGSGPAYVFLLAECLAAAGRAAGLPDDLAEHLARRTVAGGGALLAASDAPAAKLREDVTSPGGTTAAALRVLMAEGRMEALMTAAVAAAKARSIELG
jgi:pyrroline-5-carboxylate reductase